MSDKAYCPTCGQSTDKNKHNLARMLATILMSVQDFTVPFHLQKDTNLTKNQYNNFQKLRYWELVSNHDVDSGYWYITDRGRKFLNGEIKIPYWVQTFNKRIVGWSDERISVQDCSNIATNTYKKKPEYLDDQEPFFNGELL